MCIYFKDKPELTYENREHIFSAAIGGKKRLPKGYVSDQANELFSKYELQTFRNSLISMPRSLYGPGKKGSLSKNFQTPVNVIEYEDGTFNLGYMDGLTEVTIPHILIKDGEMRCGFDIALGEGYLSIFLKELNEYKGEFTVLHQTSMPDHSFMVGLHGGKGYFVSNRRYSSQEIANGIKFILHTFERKTAKVSMSQKFGNHHRILSESVYTARTFGKTALNVLAHIKGSEYVLHNTFDQFRQWIIDENIDYEWPKFPYMKGFPGPMPPHSHWCVITKAEQELLAVVSYYDTFSRSFVIGKDHDSSISHSIGYICDWQNRKEYNLLEWVVKMCKETGR